MYGTFFTIKYNTKITLFQYLNVNFYGGEIMDINSDNNYITKKEFCEMCGISDRTAYKLIVRNKIVAVKCCDRLRHYYKIHLSEVERYLRECELKHSLSSVEITAMKKYYSERLRDYPELMYAADVREVTGYAKESIRKWVVSGKLAGVIVYRKTCIAKSDLISFLSGPIYMNITRKSEKHISALRELNMR